MTTLHWTFDPGKEIAIECHAYRPAAVTELAPVRRGLSWRTVCGGFGGSNYRRHLAGCAATGFLRTEPGAAGFFITRSFGRAVGGDTGSDSTAEAQQR